MTAEQKNAKKAEKRSIYDEILRNVDENEKTLVDSLVDEVVFYEVEMEALRELPFIAVHPKNPALQKTTPASRLYKQYATSYMNAIRILLNVLRKVDSDAQDDLLRRLEEFTG